ncbi:MAG: zinc ribbon domain-containing protein [Clostridia bacterium]|nr:zinc ribbon domain-containing protein [Clostridia bacterium]
MKICKSCGEINQTDSVFCCACGAQAFVFSEEKVCPHCGAINDKKFTHCTNCGNSMAVPTKDAMDFSPAPTVEENKSSDGKGSTAVVEPAPVAVHLKTEMPLSAEALTQVSTGEVATCPHCGATISINQLYCHKCGKNVAVLHAHRVLKRKVCPVCNTPNLVENAYCAYCYASLAGADVEDLQLVHDSKTVGSVTFKQAFAEGYSGKRKICANCSTLNGMDELFCTHCGLKLDADEQKNYCPNCGAQNPSDTTFCSRCGWSFDGTTPEQKSAKWKCAKCNFANDLQDAFCTHCGAKNPHPQGGSK